MLGMTHSLVTGKLVSEIIDGDAPSVDLKPLRLSRFRWQAAIIQGGEYTHKGGFEFYPTLFIFFVSGVSPAAGLKNLVAEGRSV